MFWSKRWIAGILIVYGCFTLIMYISVAIDQGKVTDYGWIWLGIAPLIFGIVKWRQAVVNEEQILEKCVLQLAVKHHNLLTAADVALGTSMTLEQAETVLQKMCAKHMLRLMIANNGVFVYESELLLTDEQKMTADHIGI